MVWDGNCGFCAYWVTHWQKKTTEVIVYKPYQEAAADFNDIPLERFKEASRLIESDGKVYSGPRSAYRTFTYNPKGRWRFLDRWYAEKPWFESLSDRLYAWVATNRSSLFKLTKAMFGSNPEELRPFWVIYVCVIFYLIYLFI